MRLGGKVSRSRIRKGLVSKNSEFLNFILEIMREALPLGYDIF